MQYAGGCGQGGDGAGAHLEDPHLGKGSYCVVERHADGGACSVPDYAVIKLFRHIVQGEGPDTIVQEIDEAVRRANI